MTEREAKIWLDGTECDLRPVTAAAYLAAKREAEGLEDKYGADENAKSLLLGACLAAAGLYENGEKKFGSGEEALLTLSAEEILFAAQEYRIPEYPAVGAREGTGSADALEQDAEKNQKMKTDDVPKNRETGRGAEEDFMTYRRELGSDDVSVIFKNAPRHGENGTEPAQAEKSPSVRPLHFYGETDRESVLRFSAFVERDCRRYDGAFERY